MTDITRAGTFALGDRTVKRLGYGAMQLAGPGVFGPPKDRHAALAVLREAVANGVDHIDTSDFYGPHITNALIREALHPYPDDLVIVTKIGARRGADKSWNPAFSPEELTAAVHDNLRNLGLDVLEVVNLRLMFGQHGPAEGSLEAPLTVLADLQRQGLVRHIGVSNVTPTQIAEARAHRLRAEPLQPRSSERRGANRRSGGSRRRLYALLPPGRLYAPAIERPVGGGEAY
jgi:aryl-alcohol dehydrogenase-like predicted oxidoreductase